VVLQISRELLRHARPITGREFMSPPKFANACAACHLLTFDKRFEEGVPHDKPEGIHAFLVKKFSDYIATHRSELNEMQYPQQKLTGRPPPLATQTVSPTQWVAERVAVSEELLWHKTCSQCHAISATKLEDVKIARWDAINTQSRPLIAWSTIRDVHAAGAQTLPVIAPANITLQWLPHSRFDHDAHRGFSCTGCHQKAVTSTETSDILIPGIATCQKCHAPGADHAESRCYECHTYHDWSQRKEVKPTFTLPALHSAGN
jgi:hypothetical protein